MCRLFLILAAFCALYTGVSSVPARANDDKKDTTVRTLVVPDAAAITKIGVSLNDVFARRDSKRFRDLTAADFSYTCSACNSKVESLAGEKALAHASSWIMGGATEAIDPSANVIQFYTIQDSNAQVDMVTLTMTQEVEYPTDNAKTFTYTTRQLWVRVGNVWKLKSLVRL